MSCFLQPKFKSSKTQASTLVNITWAWKNLLTKFVVSLLWGCTVLKAQDSNPTPHKNSKLFTICPIIVHFCIFWNSFLNMCQPSRFIHTEIRNIFFNLYFKSTCGHSYVVYNKEFLMIFGNISCQMFSLQRNISNKNCMRRGPSY